MRGQAQDPEPEPDAEAGGEPEARDRIDFEGLEGYLRVLGYANRLELLTMLRDPRTIDEIRLSPAPAQAGESPDRAITRQAVQKHLDRLMEIGLVRSKTVKRPGKRSQNAYQTDHARLFALVEEFRRLCKVPPTRAIEPLATTALPAEERGPGRDVEGPRLVLVHGVHEGRTYPLRRADLEGPRGWVIGREADLPVALPFDPFVSKENAEVLPADDGGYEVMDLRTAKNGTFVNWERLPVGGRAPLASGDVVGVGRSLLVFKEG